MVINKTNALAVKTHAVSPEFIKNTSVKKFILAMIVSARIMPEGDMFSKYMLFYV
jgi:hypothetical protein